MQFWPNAKGDKSRDNKNVKVWRKKWANKQTDCMLPKNEQKGILHKGKKNFVVTEILTRKYPASGWKIW